VGKKTVLATIGPALAGVAISAATWSQIPDPMPIHWGASGEPNGWAPRVVGLLMLPLIGLIASAITGWAMRRGKLTEGMTAGVVLGMGGFHLGMHALAVQAALHPTFSLSLASVIVMMGALFGGLGLVMPQLEQNRWAGVRTPWSLADEVNWKLTHRFAAWSMGISGVACMVAAVVLPVPFSFWVGMTAVLLGSLSPVGYSYVIHRMRRS